MKRKTNLHIITCVVLLVLGLVSGSAEEQRSEWPLKGLPDEAHLAWQSLQVADVFAFGPIGIGGDTSSGELSMRILARYPNAVAIFQRIIRSCRTEGQLYALVALHALDPAAYAEARKNVAAEQRVSSQAGCIGGKVALADVLKEVDAGRYDTFVPKPPRR